MESSVPVMALTFLGVLIVILGLFAAGSMEVVVVGLAAIAVAGILQVLGARRS